MAKCPATKLSLEYLRSRGYRADVVERILPSKPFPKRKDLFDIFDIVAIHPERSSLEFVQTTSALNRHARIAKIKTALPLIYALCLAGPGVAVVLHSWKRTKRGYELIAETCDGAAFYSYVGPSMAEVRAMVRQKEKADRQHGERVGG